MHVKGEPDLRPLENQDYGLTYGLKHRGGQALVYVDGTDDVFFDHYSEEVLN